ncbi:MAG: hypothetical protein ACHQ51_04305 [Elusimicrobiota bacterium]
MAAPAATAPSSEMVGITIGTLSKVRGSAAETGSAQKRVAVRRMFVLMCLGRRMQFN